MYSGKIPAKCFIWCIYKSNPHIAKRRTWNMLRRRIFRFVVTAIIISCATIYYNPSKTADFFIRQESIHDEETILSEKKQESPACFIPKLDMDWSWLPPTFKQLDCSATHKDDPIRVQVVDGDKLEFSVQADLVSTLKCVTQDVTMPDDYHTALGPARNLSLAANKDGAPFASRCPAEVFQLTCFSNKEQFLQQIYRCIVRKQSAVDSNAEPDEDRLNLLLIGLDSLSRQGWIEQMKRTTKFLNEDLEAVTFEGYTIIGDASTQNFLGLATGHSQQELTESRKGHVNASHVDDFPFIWRTLKEKAGYVTLWDEDMPGFGSLQYRLGGFKNPPRSLDYYGRKFQLPVDSAKPRNYCLGEISMFEEQIQLFRQLSAIYPDPIPKCVSTFNTPFTHTIAKLQKAYLLDAELLRELRWLHERGLLNRTALILHSDHGPRYGPERATYQGKIHERLPYLSIALPSWYRMKFRDRYEAMKGNSKLLTSAMDVHTTLLEIAGLKLDDFHLPHGKSLFKPLPFSRTCADAGIAPHFCSCLDRQNNVQLNPNDSLVIASLQAFEKWVNEKQLSNVIRQDLCEPLSAKAPFSASKFGLNHEVSAFGGSYENQVFYLQISFWTEPGYGQWEVTFQWDEATNSSKISPDQISRTNRYGNAPWCIANTFPDLREFCFCKEPKENRLQINKGR